MIDSQEASCWSAVYSHQVKSVGIFVEELPIEEKCLGIEGKGGPVGKSQLKGERDGGKIEYDEREAERCKLAWSKLHLWMFIFYNSKWQHNLDEEC